LNPRVRTSCRASRFSQTRSFKAASGIFESASSTSDYVGRLDSEIEFCSAEGRRYLAACEYHRRMAPEWQPEWVVTSDLAQSLIERYWPALAPVSPKELGAGWDNTVYLVNNSLVFRFPRRTIAVPLIETEVRLLPWLAPKLPLVIPNPVYAGSASDEYPFPFAGYSWIEGTTLTRSAASEGKRKAMAKPLAHFLRALHSVPSDEAGLHGASGDNLRRLDTASRRARTAKRLDGLVKAGLVKDRTAIDDLLDRLPVIERPATGTLVHGDLHSSQIIVNDRHELVGIVDWGDVHIGDPAVDFAAIHAIVPRQAHRDFFKAYGAVDPLIWEAARGRALWHTTAVLAQASDVSDVPGIVEAQSCLARLVES